MPSTRAVNARFGGMCCDLEIPTRALLADDCQRGGSGCRCRNGDVVYYQSKKPHRGESGIHDHLHWMALVDASPRSVAARVL
jgi:hypothetical protein